MTPPAGLAAPFAASLLNAGIRGAAGVAVALSGGPDSMALAALVAGWHQQQGAWGEPPLALIVDHRLREESSAEAAAVAQAAAALGLQPHILQVDWVRGRPRAQDKMAAAREARYALLLEACSSLGRTHLLVAHHADDQAETFLLRLLHASGVSGLGCMPLTSSALSGGSGVTVVRPLLWARKAVLEEYCKAERLPYVVDPTNADLSFARNSIRHLLWQQGGEEQHHSTERHRAGQGSSNDIVADVLRLQQLCARVGQAQQAQAAALLQRAILLSSGVHIPTLSAGMLAEAGREYLSPQSGDEAAGSPEAPACELRGWLGEQGAQDVPRLSSLLQILANRLPAGLPYAIYSVRALGTASSQAVLVASLSQLLGAVSGQPYPASSRATESLGAAVCGGKMSGKFTGAGCYVQPIPGSKGRLCIVAPLAGQAQVAAAMQGVLSLLPASVLARASESLREPA